MHLCPSFYSSLPPPTLSLPAHTVHVLLSLALLPFADSSHIPRLRIQTHQPPGTKRFGSSTVASVLRIPLQSPQPFAPVSTRHPQNENHSPPQPKPNLLQAPPALSYCAPHTSTPSSASAKEPRPRAAQIRHALLCRRLIRKCVSATKDCIG